MVDSDRQANCEIEIEITEAMINAGVRALGCTDVSPFDTERELVSRVFRSMAKMREVSQETKIHNDCQSADNPN